MPTDLNPGVFPLLGGVLLSASTSLLLVDYGRPFGCSGSLHSVLKSLFRPSQSDPVKLSIVLGLFVGGSFASIASTSISTLLGRQVFDPFIFSSSTGSQLGLLGISGLVVGVGTVLSNGCTSGHMLCGVSRGNARSIISTAIFFPTAVAVHRFFGKNLPDLTHSEPPRSVSIEDAGQPYLALAGLLSPLALYLACRYPLVSNRDPSQTRKASSAVTSTALPFLLGVLFSSGLVLATMTRPSVVLSFFNFPLPSFDPSLLGVAGGGLGLNVLIYWSTVRKWVKGQAGEANGGKGDDVKVKAKMAGTEAHAATCAPTFSGQWSLPELSRARIDGRLALGSLLFGIGWGMSGICPGPALVNLGASPLNVGLWAWFGPFAVGSYMAG